MVGASGTLGGTLALIRPRRSLLKGALLSVLVGGVPLFGVLYWLSISQGSWHRVLVAQLLFMACCAFGWARFNAGFVRVDDLTITKQAFLVRTVVPREDVAAILIAETYRGSSSETIPQLLALDAANGPLLRLRGIYWSREDMLRVAEATDAPIELAPVPMTLREFYALHPGVAYWYEGRTWLAGAGIVVAFVGSTFAIGWLLTAAGVPVSFPDW